jgi:hypothetical protein
MRDQEKRQARGGWQQWSEAKARRMLAAFARSGASASAFAKSRGITTRRIQYWSKRLGDEASVEFVPVPIPGPTAGRDARIEIAAGDVVVRLREGTDVEYVAQLVVAIGGRHAC